MAKHFETKQKAAHKGSLFCLHLDFDCAVK